MQPALPQEVRGAEPRRAQAVGSIRIRRTGLLRHDQGGWPCDGSDLEPSRAAATIRLRHLEVCGRECVGGCKPRSGGAAGSGRPTMSCQLALWTCRRAAAHLMQRRSLLDFSPPVRVAGGVGGMKAVPSEGLRSQRNAGWAAVASSVVDLTASTT